MSQVDFQNGFVVGMALGGKNGSVGGVTGQEVLVSQFYLLSNISADDLSAGLNYMTLNCYELSNITV